MMEASIGKSETCRAPAGQRPRELESFCSPAIDKLMNTTPLTNIAPEIFRKRLLIEGYFRVAVTEDSLRDYFSRVTSGLGLRTYGDPIIHRTSGAGKEVNEGFDGFVPLIDSGIYIAVWVNPKFLSTIIYTCGEFDEEKAVRLVEEIFRLEGFQSAIF
jgi:hypothetical protein